MISKTRCFVILFFLAAQAVYAQNVDAITMKNGDRLSGEIKKIEHGLLYIDAPYVSGEQIAVDWLQVERVESTRRFRIELESGARLTGLVQLDPANDEHPAEVTVHTGQQEVRVPPAEVTGLARQKENFFRQLKGNIDFGYSYTSGNDQLQGNIDTSTKYESPKYLMEADYTSAVSLSNGSSETNRHDITTLFERYFRKRNFVFGGADFLNSSQQK